MAIRLQEGVGVERSEHGPTLQREGTDVVHPLQVGEALALSLLDAYGDETTARQLLRECLARESLGTENADSVFDHVLHRFHPFLDLHPEPAGERLVDLEWLRAAHGFSPRREGRAVAPEAVTWLVTLGCNRRCPYCFYDVFHHGADARRDPEDATLPTERALAMVREMGQIGAGDLYLTGGEPLLRSDLLAIISAATENRVRTHLVTKFAIDTDLADRLARAGIYRVTVSLDDARPRIAAGLAGAHGYLEEAKSTLRALMAAGIPVEVNGVVTALNADALDELALLLIDLGVPRLSLGNYSPPEFRAHAQRLVPPEGRTTADEVARLAERFAGRLIVESSGSGLPDEKPCGSQQVCDVGFTALDVLPDGSVTRCRYLPEQPSLVVGSVADSSLREIWRSPRLGALMEPEPDSYAGTACHGCGGFGGCNARGRCYFTALGLSERLHAPDAFCRQ